MQDNSIIPELLVGHVYTCNVIGVEMVEFHVDEYNEFQRIAIIKYPLGGALSIRYTKPERLFIFGQDECIFN